MMCTCVRARERVRVRECAFACACGGDDTLRGARGRERGERKKKRKEGEGGGREGARCWDILKKNIQTDTDIFRRGAVLRYSGIEVLRRTERESWVWWSGMDSEGGIWSGGASG